MKKLSRIAALLAAGAALLMVGAGFVSCSEDDGEEDNSPKLTISADSAVSVEAGEAIDVVLTATLKNDSFAGAIPSLTDLSAYVTVTPSNAASFENDLAVTAAEDIAADGTTAKVRLRVTTTDEAVSGTIKVTIAGDALKSGKDLTSNALSYTIAGENGGGDSTVATAKTYSFAGGENGIVATDVTGWDTAKMESDGVLQSPVAAEGATQTLNNGAVLYYKGSNVGTFRFRHDKVATLDATTITALNYNGGLAEGDLSSGVTLSSVDRYVKIPVDGAGTITASVVFKGGKDTDGITGGPFKAALVDSNGALIGSVTDGPVLDSTTATVIGTVSEAKDVYLVFSRNGAVKSNGKATGGFDVTSIAVAPAAN